MQNYTARQGAVETVGERNRAKRLLHPLRQRILGLARTPASATELARSMGMPRQNVNYHVRELARAGFLRPAGRRRRRNLVERRYVATAEAYVLLPEVLGPVSPARGHAEDAFSAARLLTLTSAAQSELSRAGRQASERGKRLATLSMDAELRFESAEQRALFAQALESAITDAIGRFSSPARKTDGTPGTGRPFRLILGVYPIPPAEAGNTGEMKE
jgi:DNA-binding transcriptional ArsR family regulator